MSKAIFTARAIPTYDNRPERYYHFPKTYRNQVEQALNDYIVYYEPRRASDLAAGGRQSYFGFARVAEVIEDRTQADHFYAVVDDYLDFDEPVPFKIDNFYYESILQKSDGSTNKGAFGRAVRFIPDAEFDAILKAGFTESIAVPVWQQTLVSGFEQPQAVFERPIIERMVSKPYRERSFMHNVRAAYANRCAMTGLKLINGGGRPEVQAAHIQPVAEKGPDSIRNGIALSGTVHWMFDRGLISISDDYDILVAERHVPEDALRLLNTNKRLNLPKDQLHLPNPYYLKYHRENIFKGV